MSNWSNNISRLTSSLGNLSVKDASSNELGEENGFSLWKEWTIRAGSQNRCIFFVGNGASASMAGHFAADIAKNAGIRTQVFTDYCLMTAMANDISYEEVFAEPLRLFMVDGDMLIAVSSSGNSPNIRRAVETARGLGGTVVTLTAMEADNAIGQLGDLNFHVPAKTYSMSETAHAAVLHYWIDSILKEKIP